MRTLLAIIILACAACTSTVTPKPVNATQASWDSGAQNSGFLGFFPDGSAHLTVHARDRYNVLVTIYGKDFLVPLKSDAGVTALPDGTYQIDAEHLADFMVMNEKHQSGIPPKGHP